MAYLDGTWLEPDKDRLLYPDLDMVTGQAMLSPHHLV